MTTESLEDVFDLPSVTWDQRRSLPDAPGVYFALAGDLLVYIGKSEKGIRQRWRQHPDLKRIRYFGGEVRIAYVEIDDLEQVRAEERRLIRLFEPALNGHYVPGGCTGRGRPWPFLRPDWNKNRRPRGSQNKPRPPA